MLAGSWRLTNTCLLGWDGRAEGGFSCPVGASCGHGPSASDDMSCTVRRVYREISEQCKFHIQRNGTPPQVSLVYPFLEAAKCFKCGKRVRQPWRTQKGWFKNNPGQDSGSHVAALEIAPRYWSESRVLPSCSEMKTRLTHWAKWIYGWSFHLGILLSFVPLRTPCL